MDYYDNIMKLDLSGLKIGEPVYLRMLKLRNAGGADIPVLVTTKTDDTIGLTYIGDKVPVIVNMDTASYGTDWLLMRKLLSVHTPDGDIVATDKDDPDYPGIKLTLHRPSNTSNINILLAMTEYVSGGELINTDEFSQNNQADMRTRTIAFNRTTRRMTAGLVTRAFPDDGHSDRQTITLHHSHQQNATIVMYDSECRTARSILNGTKPDDNIDITYTAEFPDRMQVVFNIETNDGEIESSLALIDAHNNTCAIIRNLTGWSGETKYLTYMGIEYVVSFEVT